MHIFPCKLTHPMYDSCAEIKKGRVAFTNKVLESKVNSFGILIPHYMQGSYAGKRVIYPCDAEFVQAFVEVYYPFSLKEQGYHWEKLDDDETSGSKQQ